MLLPRLWTVLIGGSLVLASIYFGSLPFFFMMLALVLVGVREFYRLARETGYPCYPLIGVIGSGLVIVSIFLNGVSFGAVTDNQATAALISLLIIAILFRSLSKGPADTSLSEWSITLFGIFYVAWSLGHLILVRDLRPWGREITFLLFAMIWAADITAYIIGSQWGAHPIAKSISPKKSWEGTIAGLCAAACVAVVFQTVYLKTELSIFEAVAMALVIGSVAFASDLGESILKRGAGVKDSSHLLPGHGGILDRFDSFLLTAPLYYYYWAFLKH